MTGIGFKKGESLLTNSPGYELYKQLISLGKVVTVYDPIVQDCYMKNDIVFCSRNQFTLENLHDKYDLILVNLKIDSDEEFILNTYEKLGGKVHIF